MGALVANIKKMNTNKKNQHYLPKFYLRNFSFENNRNQIGIFNIKKGFFHQTAPLKNQGSKNFFYGQDGVIEDKLSNFEGHLSKSIKLIIDNVTVPKKNDIEHFQLLNFVGLTDLRNPVLVENIKNARELMKKNILELHPNADIKKLIPEISHQNAINLALSGLNDIVDNIVDLDFKLLINKTKFPFISSDFPVVKYNKFLENKNWKRGKTGYGNTGLKIFLPINPEITIILFDPMVYKVGHKTKSNWILENERDIHQLNMLQILNCLETVFFNEKCTEHYIRGLFEKCKNKQRANQPKSKVSYFLKKGEKIDTNKNKNLMILGSTDCEINLDLNGLKIHSGSKKIDMRVHTNILRPLPRYLAINNRQ